MGGADVDFRLRAVRQYLGGETQTEVLCRVFGILERTPQRWAQHYREQGTEGLHDRSRWPDRSPRQTPSRVEARIPRMRRRHPAWGGKHIHATLARKGVTVHWTTVHRIPRRNGLTVRVSKKPKASRRFQRHRVDSLWRMDVYEFRIAGVGKVYVVTILDDRSRYLVMARAYRRKRAAEAVNALWWALRDGRKPVAVYVDNPIGWRWRYNDGGPKGRWRCRACRRTFVEDDGFLGRRVPPEAICAAWDLFFRGVSLRGISRHLRVCWRLDAGERAVLNWVLACSRLLADYVESVLEKRKVDGVRRWHEDIAVVHLQGERRYVVLLRGRGRRGRPILLAARWARDRGEGHAVAVLREAKARTRALPERIVSDGEWSFLRAYWRVLGLRHRGVRLVHGGPIAARRHGVEHNNNPAEQAVRGLKERCRHMNGFGSDASAAELLRGWFVHMLVVNTHGRASTWAERAGLHLGLPKNGPIRELVRQAIGWRRSR